MISAVPFRARPSYLGVAFLSGHGGRPAAHPRRLRVPPFQRRHYRTGVGTAFARAAIPGVGLLPSPAFRFLLCPNPIRSFPRCPSSRAIRMSGPVSSLRAWAFLSGRNLLVRARREACRASPALACPSLPTAALSHRGGDGLRRGRNPRRRPSSAYPLFFRFRRMLGHPYP